MRHRVISEHATGLQHVFARQFAVHSFERVSAQVPIPEQHYKIALQLYQRRYGITLAELAKAVELERDQVQNGLQYLEQHGLAVCHGRRRAARWAATARLRLVGPKSAASAAGRDRPAGALGLPGRP